MFYIKERNLVVKTLLLIKADSRWWRMATLIMRFVCEVMSLTHLIKILFNIASLHAAQWKLINILQKWMVQLSLWKVTVKVLECTSKRRMHRSPLYHRQIIQNHRSHKSLVTDSCEEKQLFPWPRHHKLV